MGIVLAIECGRCGEGFQTEREFAAHKSGFGQCWHPAVLGMRLQWTNATAGPPTVWAFPPALHDDGQIHD